MVKRSQRLVALFAAVIILLEVAAVPQKAKAVAITASVVASVAAIMTACGVSYWAASQTDAIDYLGGKIDDYLSSLDTVPESYEDWLGISASSQLFEVVSGGVLRFGSGVANKVLGFVRWFVQSEGVETGGAEITSGGTPIEVVKSTDVAVSNLRVRADSSGNLVVTADSITGTKSSVYKYLGIFLPGQGAGCRVTITELNYSGAQPRYSVGNTTSVSGSQHGGASFGTMVVDGSVYVSSIPSSQYLCIRIAASATTDVIAPFVAKFSFSWADPITPPLAVLTPDTVSVPQDVSDNDTFDVSPSVMLTEGMSVDDAATEIFDGVISEDGLTSSGEVVEPPALDLSGILEYLGSILNAILSIPSHIASGVQSIVTTLGQKVDAFKDAVHGFLSTFDYYLYDIQQRVTEMAHDVTMLISDRLEYLFVPDEIYVQNYVQSIMHLFDGRVGILTFPLSVFVDFLTRFSSIADGDHSFHWGNINEPFSGKQVIAAGSYDLDDAVASFPMATVYSIYLVVVKAIIAFWFLRLCQRKYELIVNGH